ncbi:MAG: hypothetical protein M3Y53_00585 [Thermoproteota archaeon]|nr:hypothetical protein [Thermoproteota archaeon]
MPENETKGGGTKADTNHKPYRISLYEWARSRYVSSSAQVLNNKNGTCCRVSRGDDSKAILNSFDATLNKYNNLLYADIIDIFIAN